MTDLEKAIPNYLKILDKKLKPKFKLNKKLLNEKIKEAFKILENCELCERKCHKNRLKDELGICKVGDKMQVSSIFEHLGEEYFFVPSLTIFFISCTFSCQFCQNWTISQRIEKGELMNEKRLAEVIDAHKNCKNMNFVGGSPTPYLPMILKTLKYINADLPVVWNSNFYMSEKSMDLLRGIVDVYLSDFKYGNDKCAERLSKIKNYTEIIKRNHLTAFKDSKLVIRHLILPNHIGCCSIPILNWVKEKFKDKVIMNIMSQYHPNYLSVNFPDIDRCISEEEFNKVVKYAERLGLNFIT